MKKIVFIFFLSIILMACEEKSQKETVNESKNKLEQGNADSAGDFFEGIVGEIATIQAKMLNMTDHLNAGGELSDSKSTELAQKLLDESERILNIINGLTPVGNGGSELKSRAYNYLSSSKEVAQAFISQNEEETMNAINKLVAAEEAFLSYQQTYARLNNFKIQGEVDPRDLQ